MINTGAISLMRDAQLVRKIQDYYATADSMREFEARLSESRAVLVDAQKDAALSPVDATPAVDLAAACSEDARHPPPSHRALRETAMDHARARIDRRTAVRG
jgi:hypothetical protein